VHCLPVVKRTIAADLSVFFPETDSRQTYWARNGLDPDIWRRSSALTVNGNTKLALSGEFAESSGPCLRSRFNGFEGGASLPKGG